jgi:hypothetical protein
MHKFASELAMSSDSNFENNRIREILHSFDIPAFGLYHESRQAPHVGGVEEKTNYFIDFIF